MSKTKFDTGHVERFRASGLPLTRYCREQGINASALQYHLAKTRRAAEPDGTKFVCIASPVKPEWFTLTLGSNGFRIRLNVDLAL